MEAGDVNTTAAVCTAIRIAELVVGKTKTLAELAALRSASSTNSSSSAGYAISIVAASADTSPYGITPTTYGTTYRNAYDTSGSPPTLGYFSESYNIGRGNSSYHK
jgi:hypothetical protein